MDTANRNRCCLACLLNDPNDPWTHCFQNRLPPCLVWVFRFSVFIPGALMFCVFLCRVTDIKTLLSQHWETRRNCLRRKNVAQFCNNQNSRDGRCVCVQCPFLSPSIMKNLPNDLIPDPLFQRSHGILTTCSSCPTSSEFDTHTHTHAHSRPSVFV